MISTNDMRAGQAIVLDGTLYQITDYERMKPGKGPTFVKVKIKDLKTGRVLDHTWRGEQKVELAILQNRKHQYLYEQGGLYHFMDMETYDQIALPTEQVAGVVKYLLESMEIDITFHKDNPVKVSIPDFVEMKIAQTDPGVKGDTATGGTKPATIESGAVIQVPLFVNQGDVIKVDTRTDTYISRV